MDTTFELAKESKQPENLQSGKNWQYCEAGAFDGIKDYVMENKSINLKCPSKLFLHKLLGLTGAEISINFIKAGTEIPFKHKHKENEEIIIVLSGQGTFYIDKTELKVKEGSILRISPEGIRSVSTAGTGDLTYICIQVKAGSLTNYTLTDAQML